MTERSNGYRDKTFYQFWKTERLPFLLTLPLIFGIGICSFLIISSFNKGFANLVGGLFFLGFISAGYMIYYKSMYSLYQKGFLIYTAIDSENKQVIKNAKIYNGNVSSKFIGIGKVLDKGLSLPIYEFNKADIILTDYSLILLGVPLGHTNIKYLAPIELIFKDKGTDFSANRAKIIKVENNPDRVIFHVNDDKYKKTIKINIKSDIEIVKQWLTSNISKPG